MHDIHKRRAIRNNKRKTTMQGNATEVTEMSIKKGRRHPGERALGSELALLIIARLDLPYSECYFDCFWGWRRLDSEAYLASFCACMRRTRSVSLSILAESSAMRTSTSVGASISVSSDAAEGPARESSSRRTRTEALTGRAPRRYEPEECLPWRAGRDEDFLGVTIVPRCRGPLKPANSSFCSNLPRISS